MITDGLRVEVTEPADALPELAGDCWSAGLLAVHPRRIGETLRAPGWRHQLAVARDGTRVLGVLSMSQRLGARFPAAIFDPRSCAPDLPARESAQDYLLVGGHFDLASGAAVRSDLGPDEAARVRCELAAAAFAHAERNGLTAVALYLGDAERAEWAGRYRAEQVSEYATVELPEPTWEGYLAGLRHSRRSVVVRDQRALDARGLRAVAVPAAAVLDEAVPLIADVQANHGAREHPELLRYRLERWIAHGAGEPVAFALRENGSGLIAVSFGRRCGDVVELYEIGLLADLPDRGLGYAEVLVYAPLRHAVEHGCHRLRLGCDSIHPKRLRGAAVSPVWALSPG